MAGTTMRTARRTLAAALIVVLDEGASGSLSTTMARTTSTRSSSTKGGLMAGIGIEGSKISRFEPKP
jgi:lipid-binding SYLF domain-containing protein